MAILQRLDAGPLLALDAPGLNGQLSLVSRDARQPVEAGRFIKGFRTSSRPLEDIRPQQDGA